MNTLNARTASLVFAVLCIATGAQAQVPNTLLHSLIDPATNALPGARQGYSVALEGDFAVAGAPYNAGTGVVKVYSTATGALLHTLINPRPDRVELFGFAVALSGTRLVVGASRNGGGAFFTNSVFVYELAGPNPTLPVLSLIDTNGPMDDAFGEAVAISGTRVAVAARRDNSGASHAGCVYVYDLAGVTPSIPVLKVANPDPAEDDLFGISVAISGARLVAGAFLDDAGAMNSGSAYVFDLGSATPAAPFLTLTNPSPAVEDFFGFAVAISSDRVVVGAYQDDTGAFNTGSAYVYDPASATPGVPILSLNNPSPQTGEGFGFSVALSGTRLLVGAYADRIGGIDAGSAYVYDLAGVTPLLPVITIPNPSPSGMDAFGFDVALSGTQSLIGAFQDDTMVADGGSAYLYDLSSGAPAVPTATLNQPSLIPRDYFGLSVAVSGPHIVAGAPYDDTGAQDAGRAYVYDLTRTNARTPSITLTNPNPARDDHFGYAVAVSGTRVVIGAPHDDEGADNAGSVYVYDLSGATPTVPLPTLTNPSPAEQDWFGWSVAIAGAYVVVGVPYDDSGAQDAGLAYVYNLAGITPSVPVTTLTNPSPKFGEAFGWSVAVSGTRVVVGAWADDTGATTAGIAYVYDLTSATPSVPTTVLTNPSPALGDYFGISVAISGTRVAVGAWGDEVEGINVGSAYVFDLAIATPTAPIATLTNPSPTGNDHFATRVAISGTRVVVGADENGPGATGAGRVYVYDLSSATPTVPVATLLNPSPEANDAFGNSVAVDGATIVTSAPFDDTNAADRGAAYVFGLRPVLSIAPAAPGFATISWTPATSSGFELRYTESVAPEQWFNAPSGPTNPVTVPVTTAPRFYRLFQP